MNTPSLPQTLAQKLIARASGRSHVAPGDIVTCDVDLAMSHDSSGPRRVAPLLERLGVKVWDPEKYVIVTDHYLPASDDESRAILRFTRDWVAREGIRHFHDGVGICHVVLPEQGHLRPGMLAVGGDSHSPTGGAFGAYMFGVGATEMLGVLVTGQIWLRVPDTIGIDWEGRFAPGVGAKDAMLFLCGRFGMDGGQYQAVEYGGSAVRALSMQERMTLSNMTAEFGGQAGLVAPDATTLEWLAARRVKDADAAPWFSDPEAPLLAHHRFDAGALAPQVAAPFSPANAADVGNYAGQAIDIAYIGACTGAKLDDLRMAARVLRGRRVAAGTTLMVAPASAADQRQAEREGTLAALVEAGATLLPNSCGACAGYGAHRFGENARVISSTARNFKGRMGAASAQVFLASPWTVAASALEGRIADPRPYLQDRMEGAA
ncbi:3-isopropylmalate dehydratase large subunit [Massilia oculi]|uniref:3-isopropylmalate dehydratase large subunit n=1 Tax=Massilia hydrophila TaxID=3044279 RepID=A0ABS7YCE3_9BURK|nr:3-isopropylmalate dehydratase large subunit [Massilia oculi]MCA1857370.1 3-isopropylmalate dehydratase large subunit [Massilia oculi]